MTRRRLFLSPLLLLVALLTGLGLKTSSASASAALETRVRAIDHVPAISVGNINSESPGSIGCLRPETAVSASATGVATEAATAGRGLSNHGGVLSSEVNGAGGTVWKSTGAISQNDVAPIVNSGMYGGDVNVISGVHGLPNGSTIADASMYADDVARFGNLPGVTVHNLPTMSPAQVSGLLNGPGTTIGAFCDSGACLRGFQ